MTPEERTAAFEQALKVSADLLLNSSKLVQAWITRFVVVNVALFSAVGVILEWEVNKLFGVLLIFIIPICIVGFLSSLVMMGVIFRQNEWQNGIQKLLLANQSTLGVKVLPLPSEIKKGDDKAKFGEYVETFVGLMGGGVVVAWIA